MTRDQGTTNGLAEAPRQSYGPNARLARTRLGLSLDRLAAETGLSKGHLSRFERGAKTLSVSALLRLSQALGISVSALLGERPGEGGFHLVRAGEAPLRAMPGEQPGYAYRALSSPRDDGSLNVLVVDLPADASRSGEARHAGDEAFYVLAGRVEMELGDERLTLDAGDYLQFSGLLPHRLRSVGGPSRVFIAVAAR